MKLVSYLNGGREQLGVILHDEVFTLHSLHPLLPLTMNVFLKNWDVHFCQTLKMVQKLKTEPWMQTQGIPLKAVELMAPVPHPASLRDGYAFRQHVATARRNRGLDMIPAFDEYPVFYFGNHRTICGPGEIECMPDQLQQLDYELEVAALICKPGKNIRAADADEYIGGLMVMNDFSARQLQMEEMQLSLGPAKGKDFATTIGPWLVTTDELEQYASRPKDGHTGKTWDLTMQARVNNHLLSVGMLSDMHWTFAELIERASYGVELYAGDLIGSGTVGTGCLLELNGTNRLKNKIFTDQWLKTGDRIDLEVEGLGVLSNTIGKSEDDFSILALKKGF